MAAVKINARDQITATIKEKILEANAGDFTLPFASLSSAPKNASTGKAYRGLNSLYLCILGIETVATYKQWQSLGFQVVKGSSAIQLTPPPRTIKKQRDLPDGSKEDFTIPLWGGYFNVFASSAVVSIADGSPYVEPTVSVIDLTDKLAAVDAFVANLGFDIRTSASGGAFYSPLKNFINMPHREQFTATATSSATECYYSTVLHECAHATGHSSLLDRLDLKNKRGYAFEELIAELSACFLCLQLGISNTPRADHSQYLAGWLKALDDGQVDYIAKAATKSWEVIDWMNDRQTVAVAA